MKGKKAVNVGIVAAVIAAVIFLVFVSWWGVRQMGPGLGEKVAAAEEWIDKSANKCANIESIVVTDCAEAVSCHQSQGYLPTTDSWDYKTYAVNIPLTTEYWVNLTVYKDCCWADENLEVEGADECSYNDPEIYVANEYQPLIYEVSIGDARGTYVVDSDTCCTACSPSPCTRCSGTAQEVAIYVGVVSQGTHNLRWRIITDWDDSGAFNPNPNPACDGSYSSCGGGECTRLGELEITSMIDIYCDM